MQTQGFWKKAGPGGRSGDIQRMRDDHLHQVLTAEKFIYILYYNDLTANSHMQICPNERPTFRRSGAAISTESGPSIDMKSGPEHGRQIIIFYFDET
jgi:hypothetical protein